MVRSALSGGRLQGVDCRARLNVLACSALVLRLPGEGAFLFGCTSSEVLAEGVWASFSAHGF
eukprot:3477778-Pyramimonas_sp.AAC.1